MSDCKRCGHDYWVHAENDWSGERCCECEGYMKDETKWWLEALRENLLDDDYCVATDSEAHFKIAAIDGYIARNEHLEQLLCEGYEAHLKANNILARGL